MEMLEYTFAGNALLKVFTSLHTWFYWYIGTPYALFQSTSSGCHATGSEWKPSAIIRETISAHGILFLKHPCHICGNKLDGAGQDC